MVGMPESVVVPVVLVGRHVRLEPLTLEHAGAITAAATGPRDTYAFTGVPEDEAAARSYIETALRWQAEGTAVPFATVSLAAGKVVGSTRFANIAYWDWPPGNPNDRGPGYPDDVEIGWTWLHADAQRTPVNTEAKYLMLRHAFEQWRVHRVYLKTDARNWRSRNAIERIGGKLDGVIRSHQPAFDGTVRDNAWFTILESEWPGVKQSLEQRLR
jgi:N-acetyltransferase